ncbi:MAG: hypothetical protein PHV20_05365 [Bacteroidales bacterium]|nr:hypothetical protein [Bacteroidales bacterium]
MTRPTKDEKIKFNVDYPPDTDFSAYARLLQSKWRVRNGFGYNKYGNFLPKDFAIQTKANFLTSKIRLLAEYELLRKGNFGKLIKEDRMWENLLSSQPLCFNLFGELHFDHKLATKFFRKLFPHRIQTVTEVLFEHSPGRGNKKFTGDHSAFDVFVEYTNGDKRGFIGIEVKYAESLKEEQEKTAQATFNKHETEYTRLTTSDIFCDGAIETLRKTPLSQIWRDHLLSLATRQLYDEGFFVFLFPSQNKQCQIGVDDYKKYISSDNEEKSGFYPRHLEDFISTLQDIINADWTNELRRRYLGDDV